MLPTKTEKKKRKSLLKTLKRAADKTGDQLRVPPRIGFVIDATASRQLCWKAAQEIQGQMFKKISALGALHLRLVHFGGNRIDDLGWQTSTEYVAKYMADVRCDAAPTAIIPSLRLFLEDDKKTRARTVILVTDTYEEWEEHAAEVAEAFRKAGIKIFVFLDGDNTPAEAVLRMMAETTKGRFAAFGDESVLKDLCEGVAILSAGGKKALKRLGSEQAKRLLLEHKKGDQK